MLNRVGDLPAAMKKRKTVMPYMNQEMSLNFLPLHYKHRLSKVQCPQLKAHLAQPMTTNVDEDKSAGHAEVTCMQTHTGRPGLLRWDVYSNDSRRILNRGDTQ